MQVNLDYVCQNSLFIFHILKYPQHYFEISLKKNTGKQINKQKPKTKAQLPKRKWL